MARGEAVVLSDAEIGGAKFGEEKVFFKKTQKPRCYRV